MKRINTIAIMILCLTAFNAAYAGDFQYGFKLGTPISNIRLTDRVYEHYDADKPLIWMHYFTPKFGLNFSGFGGYYVTDEIYVGIEPGFIIKGAGFSDENSSLSLQYFNLPILMKYELSDRWRILAGPEFSTLVKASLDYNGLDIDMKEFYDNGVETSVNLGVEYTATDQFWLGVRYNYGLTKVSETLWYNETGDLLGAVKEYNYYWLFYLAFGFGG